MLITPKDIVDKAFSTKFRGYDKEEVDEFLDKIYINYEELVRNKDETERYIKRLEEHLSYYTNDIPKRPVSTSKSKNQKQ